MIFISWNKIDNVDVIKFKELYHSGVVIKDICNIFNFSSNIYYKLVNDLKLEKRKIIVKHGFRNSLFYKKYHNMRNRCCNNKTNGYNNYGGRGIVVCDRWLDFLTFKDDMYDLYVEHCNKHGEDNTSLERINVNGNYEPNNCKWASNEEQYNNKTTSVFITHNNETKTVAQWSRDLNINPSMIRLRLARGITDSELLLQKPTNIIYSTKTIFNSNNKNPFKKITIDGICIHICSHKNKFVVYETYLKCLDFLNVKYKKELFNTNFTEEEIDFINNKYENFISKIEASIKKISVD